MKGLYLQEIIDAVAGKYVDPFENILVHNVNTDSRKIQSGDLYIALEGENFDGHDFVEAAFLNGAVAAILSKPVDFDGNHPVILVENTLNALQQLASFYRDKLAKPVIAVTGSVGKTSTKDMIASILSSKFDVHKTLANYNNHIGLPLTLLALEENHDVVVVEMGMRGLGEISELTHIAKPDIALITNIGLSHIERLGTQENILKAKLEILEGIKVGGLSIINMNDPLLAEIKNEITSRMVTIGVDVEADYLATKVTDFGEKGVGFLLVFEGKKYEVLIPAVGKHNVLNALFGVACGRELGMSPEEIISGISNYQSGKMRLDILDLDGIKFINDSYNASPDSMRAGIQVLSSLASNGRSIAILGNMFELGHMSKQAHYEVGKMCVDYGIHFSAVIGENAVDMARGIDNDEKSKVFETHEAIVKYMKKYLEKGDVVLIKGSRGMKMERVLELWQAVG
ncbi:MAG: UDP-N-acetylmuramoyl-tripeptide--D-alanyl-D-alanine ligase [Vallitaleaceae bacterium]|nr:UDP-N-acetylmuramoyl-tripeptide--D-alanyl-D-alanine ligase [Vallitaleaceae bacterium]